MSSALKDDCVGEGLSRFDFASYNVLEILRDLRSRRICWCCLGESRD